MRPPPINRERRLLMGILDGARSRVSDLTSALAVNDSTPLRKQRALAMAYVTDTIAVIREYDEAHGDAEKTPVQRSSDSQQLRALSKQGTYE